MKLVAIDYGRRRIGMAITAEAGVVPVRGLPTIDRQKTPRYMDRLAEIIGEEHPDLLVFGLPLDGNDAETVMSNEVRQFAAKLSVRTGIPAGFTDESLSSVRATALLRNRKKTERRDKSSIDRLAACLILDQYIRENLSSV
jgi:putative Holliday junction resolvase